VIIVGVMFTFGALSAPERRTVVGARDQNVDLQETVYTSDCGNYPNPDFPYPPNRCEGVTTPQTAETQPATTGTPADASTPVTTTSVATTSVTAVGQTVTPQRRTAATPTVSTPSLAPPEAGTTEETAPDADDVTPTASSYLICAPGERVLITGEGPPRAAFLLYFGLRVVSGGSVSLTGSFSIPLVVGHERPGSYPVTVRVRGSEQVLRELTCEVPATQPSTPTTSALPEG
jgi:hypothetical protein